MTSSENHQKPGRDVRVDALRGLMLAVMVMDHFPSLFFGYTYQLLGYVTTAEGFIFLSGLVAGRVYARYGAVESIRAIWRRALARALFIYSFHVLTFCVVFGLALACSGKMWSFETWAPDFNSHPVSALLMGITLLYQPKFLDILPMYALFILTVPVAVELGRKNRLWILLICSLIVWLWAQYRLNDWITAAISHFQVANLGAFAFCSWQMIFVLGVCAGIRYENDWLPSWLRLVALPFCVVVAAVLFLIRHGVIWGDLRYRMESLSLIASLGPVRLLNFVVIVGLVRATLSWPIDNLFVKRLALLGRHSLELFTFHIFQLYLFFGVFRSSQVKELWVIFFVATLFVPACLLEKYPNPWRNWFRHFATGAGTLSPQP